MIEHDFETFIRNQTQSSSMIPEAGSVDIVIHIATAVLAAILFIVSLIALQRERKRRLGYVCAAFALFALQQVLVVVDIWTHNTLTAWTHVLSFVILLLFFFGMVKK